MPTENDGVMIILSSPSGAGKTTLVNLLSKEKNFEVSISHTTRQPRQNEVDKKITLSRKFSKINQNEHFWNMRKYSQLWDHTNTSYDNLIRGKMFY